MRSLNMLFSLSGLSLLACSGSVKTALSDSFDSGSVSINPANTDADKNKDVIGGDTSPGYPTEAGSGKRVISESGATDGQISMRSDAGKFDSGSKTTDNGKDSDMDDLMDSGSLLGKDAAKDVQVDAPPACSPNCQVGDTCKNNIDCVSQGCDYTGHCVNSWAKSCILHHGGDTCGSTDSTDLLNPPINPTPNLNQESCCVQVPIAGTNYVVDKYMITAGRFRSFITAVNGNVLAFTQNIPASNSWWNPNWNQFMPSTSALVDAELGPYPAPLLPNPYNPDDETKDTVDQMPYSFIGEWRDGCVYGSLSNPDGVRTWWVDYLLPGDQALNPYPQSAMDERPINCIDAYLLTAFCIWDGGHLWTQDEMAAAYGGGDYPWSWSSPNVGIDITTEEPMGVDTNGLDASYYIAHEWGLVVNEFQTPFDYNSDPWGLWANLSTHMSPPGRFPLGASPSGIMDMMGDFYNATAIQPGTQGETTLNSVPSQITDVDYFGAVSSEGSFEIHFVGPSGGNPQFPVFRPAFWGYYASSGRCSY